MKKIYTLITGIALCTAMTTHAAGGPDAYGYTWITSADPGGPTYNWIDITARPGVQTVTGLTDDNSAPGSVGLGFSFHYYWNDYTQLKVGSNGWVSFDLSTSNIASSFPTIPSPAAQGDNFLAPFMSDLIYTGAGNPAQVRYWTNNVDTFIISYLNVPYWMASAPSWTGSNSFQVILCNSDSSITYQYNTLSAFAPTANVDLIVGIENSTGQIGLQVFNDVMPPNNYVVRFKYPNPVLLAVQDALPVWNNNSTNGAQFILANVAFPISTDIKNGGNTNMSTQIDLQTLIQDAVFTNQYTGVGMLPTLAAGDDSIYTYTNTWTPTVPGQYSVQTSATSVSDINSANNILTTELDVVNACASNMILSYVSGNAPSASVNWNGGANDDGIGVYFAPPVYPCNITTLQYYITSNVGNGYIAQVYADDGPMGGPGTQLFTTTVASASVVSASWNTVTPSVPITITSGGYYVVWLQGGTNIFLGCETSGPVSHHNYEILDNGWARFRYDATQDACIRCGINGFTSVPTAAMSASTNMLDVTVTNNTTGLATSYLWNFGDLTTSTLASPPPHTYAAAGTYNVCLIATSPCGADTICSSVTVCDVLTSGYSASTAALTANFTDMSSSGAITWSWDFGDSNTSTVQNPSHTYATGGTYNVCLIVTDACGQSDTTCTSVSVCAPNTASFMNNATGLNTNFMDMSSGAIDTWSWDFGDASGTSTSQSPSYTYAAPGTYNVCLIVANSCGNSDTICQTVTVCNIGVAGFTYTTDEDSIMVSDASTGGIASWFWDFGDATTSNLQNPGTHHYATGGIYTVCLITTDSCGLMDTTCVQDTILITGYNVNQAGINSIYPNPATAELAVELWWDVTSDIEIFDATGKLVYLQNEVSGNLIRIDVNDLTPGLYTLRITNKGGTTARRFVKE